MTSLPIKRVAADANVLLAAIAERAAARVFAERPEIVVVTTIATMDEVRAHLPEFSRRYDFDLTRLHKTADDLPIARYGPAEYGSHIAEASRYIGRRDPDDIALAALALKLAIPVWSNDNDFRELPLRTYTTAQLLRALGM